MGVKLIFVFIAIYHFPLPFIPSRQGRGKLFGSGIEGIVALISEFIYEKLAEKSVENHAQGF